MEPSDYDEIPLCKILYFAEVRDYWRNKAGGNKQRSENGRGAWVALCANATYTNTNTDIDRQE
jgi:hypothetical protein